MSKVMAYVTEDQLRKALEDAIHHLGTEMASNLFGDRACCEMAPPRISGLHFPEPILPMEAGESLAISISIDFNALISINEIDDDITRRLNPDE